MSGVADGLGDQLRRHRRRQVVDVDPRRHDVAKFQVTELIDAGVDGDGFGRHRYAIPLVRRCACGASTVPTRGAVGRSLNDGTPGANGRGAQRFILVLFAAQQCANRAAQALGVERLDQEPLGAAAPSEEDVRATIQQHQDRHRFGCAIGLLVTQFHADRHTAHGADLEVENDEVDTALLDTGDGVGAVRGLFDDEVRAFERGA